MSKTQLGFIGLGIMGKPMAINLHNAGYPLVVFDLAEEPLKELIGLGAERAASPADVTSQCSIVLTMLPNSPDVRAVVTGDDGILSTVGQGQIIIDMSSIAPLVSQELADLLAERGASMLDAPVSGGQEKAELGTLAFMVGGDQDVFDTCKPILDVMGGSVTRVGDVGAGQTTKACNQIAVSVANLAMAEALMLAAASDLDVAKVVDAISGGAAGSWQLTNLGPRILQDDFAPGFMVRLQQKDLKLVLAAANDVKLALPGVSLAHQYFNIVERLGGADEGTQALIKAYESQAGKKARAT